MTERTMVPLVDLLTALEREIEASKGWSREKGNARADLDALAIAYRDGLKKAHDLAKRYRQTITTQD